MRVAVSQFATTSNVQENLASCIRMITEVAACKPSLILLPEFSNTCFYSSSGASHRFTGEDISSTQARYTDHNQAWDEAVSINGSFLTKIAEQAKKYSCYIVINVTLRRDVSRDFYASNNNHNETVKSKISVTNCLFSPLGELIYQEDKQNLSKEEAKFFICGSDTPEVISTLFGELGILSGNNTLTYSASRKLAFDGAQLLCNSTSTFTLDQSRIHDPVRSFENNVFLACANKIVASRSLTTSEDKVIQQGYSQIISPDGNVLVKLPCNKEGFAYADITIASTENYETNIRRTGFQEKRRPDGTQLSKQLRPELYQELAARITPLLNPVTTALGENTPVTTNVAIFATYTSNEKAIEDVCHYIENNLSDIIQLPELFFINDRKTPEKAESSESIEQLAQAEVLSKQVITRVSAVLRPFQYLCTSLILKGKHQAVLINEHGLLATQQQLHFCQRYQWTSLGNELNVISLPLEQGFIKLVMLTADDANIPEIVTIAALHDIHLLLAPIDIQEPCEVEFCLPSKATEHRICIVAASREKSFTHGASGNLGSHTSKVVFTGNSTELVNNTNKKNIYSKNKVKAQKSTGIIVNLTVESAALAQWRKPSFNGYLNQPLVKHQYGKITKAVIHPIAADAEL